MELPRLAERVYGQVIGGMICEYFSKKSKKRLDTIRNCDILRNVDSEKRQTSGRIAQSVEQGTENPRVPSSILGPATIFFALISRQKNNEAVRLHFTVLCK